MHSNVHQALNNGDIQRAYRFLKENKADIEVTNHEGRTAMSRMVEKGNVQMVKDLFSSAEEICKKCLQKQDRNTLNTPLHVAAKRGDPEMIKLLLKHGAPVDAEARRHYRPLHFAAQEGRSEAVKALVERSAEVDCEKGTRSPKRLSMRSGHIDIALFLTQNSSKWRGKAFFQADHPIMRSLTEANILFRQERLQEARNRYAEILSEAGALGSASIPVQVYCLKKLGILCFQEPAKHIRWYIEAAKFFNSAMVLYQKQYPSVQRKEVHVNLLKKHIKRTQKHYCKNILKKTNIEIPITHSAMHDALKAIRAEATKELRQGQTLQNIAQQITKKIRILTQTLIQECLQVLGEPPCSQENYAIIGLGSMSRGEINLYSDFEFGVLLSTNQNIERCRTYFHQFTGLLQIKIINCGETEHPVLARGRVSATTTGYSLDFNNPSARTELVDTLEGMLQGTQGSDVIFDNLVKTVCFLYGNEELVNEYQERVRTYFCGSEQALKLLRADREAYVPSLLRGQSRSVDIKMDLYRPLVELIHKMCLCYGISGNTTWERLDALRKNEMISQPMYENLQNAFNCIFRLRVVTQAHYSTEKEEVFCLQDPLELEGKEEILCIVNPRKFATPSRSKTDITGEAPFLDIDVPGDGACLFHAIALGLQLNEDAKLSFRDLRNVAASHLGHNRELHTESIKAQITTLFYQNRELPHDDPRKNQFPGIPGAFKTKLINAVQEGLEAEQNYANSAEGVNDYINHMFDLTAWGGEIELGVLAELLQLQFLIYNGKEAIKPHHPFIGSPKAPKVHLLFDGDHYGLRIPKASSDFEEVPKKANSEVDPSKESCREFSRTDYTLPFTVQGEEKEALFDSYNTLVAFHRALERVVEQETIPTLSPLREHSFAVEKQPFGEWVVASTRQFYNQVSATYKKNPKALHAFGNVLQKAGQESEALNYYKQSLRLDSSEKAGFLEQTIHTLASKQANCSSLIEVIQASLETATFQERFKLLKKAIKMAVEKIAQDAFRAKLLAAIAEVCCKENPEPVQTMEVLKAALRATQYLQHDFIENNAFRLFAFKVLIDACMQISISVAEKVAILQVALKGIKTIKRAFFYDYALTIIEKAHSTILLNQKNIVNPKKSATNDSEKNNNEAEFTSSASHKFSRTNYNEHLAWLSAVIKKAKARVPVGIKVREHAHYYCPMMESVMTDPVSDGDHHIFDAQAIRIWRQAGHKDWPSGGGTLKQRRSEEKLKNEINEWKKTVREPVSPAFSQEGFNADLGKADEYIKDANANMRLAARANLTLKNEHYVDAIADYEAALAYTDDVEVYEQYARWMERGGLSYKTSRAYAFLVEWYGKNQEEQKAQAAYQKVLELAPHDEVLHKKLTDYLHTAKTAGIERMISDIPDGALKSSLDQALKGFVRNPARIKLDLIGNNHQAIGEVGMQVLLKMGEA